MTTFFTLLFLLIGVTCTAQNSFKEGYFIDNNNQQIDCLIKDIGWKDNPTKFKYKLSSEATIESASIDSIKKFVITDISYYQRFDVEIDRSSKDISQMTKIKQPIFQKEQLFLERIVSGTVNLYKYRDGDLIRFFYEKEDVKIEQLIFKVYKENYNEPIRRNERFKQQIWESLKCQNISIKDIGDIDYKEQELSKLFIKYNYCINPSEKVVIKTKGKRDFFNLSVRPGLNLSSLKIEKGPFSLDKAEFGVQIGGSLGFETEFVLPYNNNKWRLIFEPTYQYYIKEKKTRSVVIGQNKISIDYQSIEFPTGIRYYIFLKNDAQLFLNASYIFDFIFSSSINVENGNTVSLSTRNNFGFGIGYALNEKYSLEFRYATPGEILNKLVFWRTKYDRMSIMFGYRLY